MLNFLKRRSANRKSGSNTAVTEEILPPYYVADSEHDYQNSLILLTLPTCHYGQNESKDTQRRTRANRKAKSKKQGKLAIWKVVIVVIFSCIVAIAAAFVLFV
ncbi:hypothetical protein CVT26_002597 [Gymnopilus dilepis]|uniref:Uncharacterized protein n=1 Tax=Gymnopilus dilepis TaxID=231916 RepID=A0A409VF51_9AGAR|nr:hypothetical protein CVT26_002597 [Gymnopilus dilepis]